MTPEWIKIALEVIQMTVTVVIAIYVWQSNKQKANKAAIDDVDTKHSRQIASLHDRMLKAEAAIQYMPSTKEIGNIHFRIDQVGQGLSKLEGTIGAMNNTMTLIQRHLMREDDKQ